MIGHFIPQKKYGWKQQADTLWAIHIAECRIIDLNFVILTQTLHDEGKNPHGKQDAIDTRVEGLWFEQVGDAIAKANDAHPGNQKELACDGKDQGKNRTSELK